MPLIKPDAAMVAFLRTRLAALTAVHRDIAALSEASDLVALLQMGERVDERLCELHPRVINEHEMMSLRAQVREITGIGRQVLDH